MKKLLLIFIIIIVGIFWLWPRSKQDNSLAIPQVFQSTTQPTPAPTPDPINAPKTFKFDKSTDLKKELDSINPEVLDSDFE